MTTIAAPIAASKVQTANTAGSLLDTAHASLLAPYDLDLGKLGPVFGALAEHRIDYADLYFQYTRSEGWNLEEGIVKSGSFNIEQGVGVRAISGEKTAFAYSDDISFTALQDAARATRAIGRAGQVRRVNAGAGARRSAPASYRQLYKPLDPIASLSSETKVGMLEKLEKLCRKLDPRVTQVMANLGGEYEVVLVARSDGVTAADVRPLVRLSVQVIVEENGKRESGSAGGGGRTGYEYFTDALLLDYAKKAVHQAVTNLAAKAGARGHDDRGAGARLAGHPAARSHRPRARGRLQPQGELGVLGPHRRARRRSWCHRGRRRHDCRPSRLAFHR